MKRIVCLCFILLCSISFAFAQGRTNTKKPVVKKTIDTKVVEAEKIWMPFWNKFREVVKNRNKQDLKSIVSKDFYGIDWTVSNSDFNFYWERLEKMKKTSEFLRSGEVISGVGYIKTTASRIIGEYWNSKTKSACSTNYGREDWALFEFRAKKWFLVQLSFCERE